jgi:hypothetical protein
MRTLVNPRWLFAINTFPVALLLFLFWRQYQVVHSLLSKEALLLWQLFGSTLGVLGLLVLTCALVLIRKGKILNAWYGVTALISFAAYLYIYFEYASFILPWSLPRWMISNSIELYAGTFLMPTLVHALIVLIINWTPPGKKHKAGINFLLALAVPVVGYLFTQLILPLWRDQTYNRYTTHAGIILTITATVVFLFFLVRAVYIISINKASLYTKYQLAWKIPIAIVLPLFGLAVSNGHLFDLTRGLSGDNGVFGNFQSPWFYILAFINGIFLCLPDKQNKVYRMALLIGRSAGFAYTFYFFLVFLPYLPLAVVAILAIGLGFLMLVPLLLFIIHANAMYNDIAFLRAQVSKRSLTALAVLSFLLLPIAVTLSYLYDKKVLNNVLAYVYTPGAVADPNINYSSLQFTLATIKQHKKDNRAAFLNGNTPYLSAYFNWLVLDNLTLSDEKVNYIEQIFFGPENSGIQLIKQFRPATDNSKDVHITGHKVSAVYDTTQQAWQSILELELTNDNTDGWNEEYLTQFELPTGCWINDYYLWIGNRKERGILAEKKAAMWVYDQITSTNRDPGILFYQTGNTIDFRVFPFTQKEKRRTAIHFTHKEPVTLTIDSIAIRLGKDSLPALQTEVTSADGKVVYIPAAVKRELPRVKRVPYYHFLIDGSKQKKNPADEYRKRINDFLQNDTLNTAAPQFTFVNSFIKPLNANWQEQLKTADYKGGFFLERAIQQVLQESYKNPVNTYPIIVAVTNNWGGAVLNKNFADYQGAFPEAPYFHVLNNSITSRHPLLQDTGGLITDSIIPALTVLAYPSSEKPLAFLPDNGQPDIVLKQKGVSLTGNQATWQTGLAMQGSWLEQTYYPQAGNTPWLSLVKASFQSGVMSPVTSYLAVENEAQKKALKRKQDEVLSGHKSLDVDEESSRMSEPRLWIVIVLVAIVGLYRKRRSFIGQLK